MLVANMEKPLKHQRRLRLIWALTRENLSWGFANNTDADQHAHLHSLIRAFVIRFLETIKCNLATGEILIF